MLENFVKVADMPQEVIEKYKDQVPDELVQIWQVFVAHVSKD